MKNRAGNNWIRAVAFLLLTGAMLWAVSRVLERKSYFGPWNYMAKMNEFYQLEENSLDYVCLGASHMYCTVNPLEVWNYTGLTGFVLATQQQPLRASYYYLQEAFKTQSPKIVLLEGYMAHSTSQYPEAAVAYDAVDPLRLSLNKLQLIRAIVPKGERTAYYFNLIKYHSRWEELSLEEFRSAFQPPADWLKGYVCLQGEEQSIPLAETDWEAVEAGELGAENLAALEDIRCLAEDNGAQMVLLLAPYDPEKTDALPRIKAELLWAEQNGIPVIDVTALYGELGIDGTEDFYDRAHLDVDGAEKVSRYLAQYLAAMGLRSAGEGGAEQWAEDYQRYLAQYRDGAQRGA